MFWSNKTKYKYYFMRKQHGTYVLKKIIRKREPVDSIKFKDKTFVINLAKPLFMQQTIVLYFIDIDSGAQLLFDNIEQKVNPKDLDIIVGQKIIRELTKGVMSNKKELLWYAIMGAIVGALLAGLVMVMYYTGKIEEVYKEYAINSTDPQIIPLMKNSYLGVR